MSQTLGQMVTAFNIVFGVPSYAGPSTGTDADKDLAFSLIHEELMELCDAMDANDPVGMADAFTDIIYVTAQQMAKLGFPVDKLLAEVQRSNMSKLDEHGLPIKREDGKILKGPNWSPPDIEGILRNEGGTSGASA